MSRHRDGTTKHHNGKAYADVAAGKPSFQVGTPHLDHSLPPLFYAGLVSAVYVRVRVRVRGLVHLY